MDVLMDKYVDLQAKYADEQSTNREIKKELGKEDFLKLLVEQMKNQDPLNPMNNTEFIAQTTQFSSLEQLLNISDSIEKLSQTVTENQSSGDQLFSATNFIGKEVGFYSNVTRLENDEAEINFESQSAAEKTVVTIKDSSGSVVDTMTLNNVKEGMNSFTWDGVNQKGENLPEGVYVFEVKALDKEGSEIPVRSISRGLVEGVSRNGESLTFDVGGLKIAADQIFSVYENKN